MLCNTLEPWDDLWLAVRLALWDKALWHGVPHKQTTLIFGGSGVFDKGAEDGALGGVEGTGDNGDSVNCGNDIVGVGVG